MDVGNAPSEYNASVFQLHTPELVEVRPERIFAQWSTRNSCSVEHFLSTLYDKMSWRPNFNRTWCPDVQKDIRLATTTTTKIESVVIHKVSKVEVHITDNQSMNSCCRLISDHEVIFGSAIESLKHNML